MWNSELQNLILIIYVFIDDHTSDIQEFNQDLRKEQREGLPELMESGEDLIDLTSEDEYGD